MKKLIIILSFLTFSTTTFAGLNDPDYRGDENSVHLVFDRNGPDYWNMDTFEIGPSAYSLDDEPWCMEFDPINIFIACVPQFNAALYR